MPTPLRDRFSSGASTADIETEERNTYINPRFGSAPSAPSNQNLADIAKANSEKQAKSDLQEREDKIRKGLKGSFSGTIDAYKNLIGWLPGEQAGLETQVGELAGSQKKSIGTALETALGRYEGYRGEAQVGQKETLRDLAQNTRNLFQAGNVYLGSRGAGNSSATGIYSSALTNEANRRRADVQSQTNKLYSDINLQEEDTRGQAELEINAVDTWASSRKTEISQQYNDLRRKLQVAQGQANDSQKRALAELDASLFQSAMDKLNNLEALSSQYKSEVSANIGSQVDKLGETLGGIKEGSQYDVQQQSFIPLAGIEQGQAQQDGSIIGYYNGRKVQVDQEGNLLAYLD